MRRIVLPVALSVFVLLAASWSSAAPESGQAWEYGVLEVPPPGGGNDVVFCQATAEGCVETVYSRWPVGTPPSPNDRNRVGIFQASVAKALAALGHDGWELVGETEMVSPTRCPDCRAMTFKRPAR
jgi:hypothetical protein